MTKRISTLLLLIVMGIFLSSCSVDYAPGKAYMNLSAGPANQDGE